MARIGADKLIFCLMIFSAPAVSVASGYSDISKQDWIVSATANYSNDSDTISSGYESLKSEYKFSENLSFNAQLENLNMEADRKSGLTVISGKEDLSMQGLLLGIKRSYSDDLAFKLLAGAEKSSVDTSTPSFEIKADWRPIDELRTSITFSQKTYAVSPRAISLDVVKTEGLLQMNWQASKKISIEGSGSYSEFSDNNEKMGITISPSYRIVHNVNTIFGAGLRFNWYGSSEHLGNGYYSPERYQSYNIPLIYSQKFGEHNAILSIAPGMYKDNNIKNFKLAGDARAEADFKINEVLDLNMHADLIRSGGLTSSEYEQRIVGMSVKHNF